MYNQQILAYTILGICFILGIIIICWNRQRERSQEFQSKMRVEFQRKLDNEFSDQLHKLEAQRSQISINNQTISGINARISDLDREMNEKIAMNKSLKLAREEELNDFIATKKDAEEARIQKELDDWACSSQEAQEFMQNERLALLDQEYNIRKDTCQSELDHIQAELEDYRKKRNTINEDILRQRELNDKRSFYCIDISDDAKSDINYLLSIINKFHNKETIYKLIWSEYIQRPFKSMLNRVLGARDPKNVIYMIKNLETEEIYIGKTKAEASKRWTEHLKTSLNIGTIGRSNIHKALFNNWDNFAFTILEEVSDDQKLNDRERYYINFYQSDIYGYNIKSGG